MAQAAGSGAVDSKTSNVGAIPAAAIDRFITSDPTKLSDPVVLRWSTATLRRDPLNATAMRIHGYALSAKGKRDEAASAVRLAARMSRRELYAQLWLIEDEVRRGNITDALDHYNIVLTAKPKARPVLFSVLAQALGEEEISKGFVRYVTNPPNWLLPFVTYVIDYTKEQDALALTIERAGGFPRTAEFEPVEAAFLQKLVAAGHFTTGRRFYATMQGSTGAVFTHAGFTAATTNPRFVPFAWRAVDSSGVSATFQPTGREGRQEAGVRVSPAGQGVALSRLLFLAPGTYEFRATLGPNQLPPQTVRWLVRCGGSGPELNSWENGTATMAVPRNCAHQTIEMFASAGDSQEPIDFVVSDVAIKRK